MAQFDLQNKLKNAPTVKTRGGGLYQTSEEELDQLTGGRPAPITPMGANMIGANPDQAKMVGTKVQKIPAIREALQAGAGQNLADAQRTKQVSGAVSAEDEAKKKQAKGLAGLSSFDSRVDELKEANLAKAAASTQTVQVFDTTKAASNPALAAALTKLNTNPADQQAILEANKALGNTSANLMTSEQLKAQFGATSGSQVAGAAANAIAGAKGSDLTPEQLSNMGFADINTLAGAIGADPAQIANMSMSDIARAAQSRLTSDFGDVASLQQIASDPAAGAAARADARLKLREMGATGIRSVESDIDVLADDISKALNVTFNGQEMSIEDALKDDTITNFVSDYIKGTPEQKKAFELKEPGLTDFIKKHEGILADSVKALEKGVADFQATNAARTKAGEIGPGAAFDAGIVALIDPTAGELGTGAVDLASKSKFFKDMTTNPNIAPEDKVAVTSALNSIGAKFPAIAKDILKNLDFADIQKMGLNTPEGVNNYLSRLTSANYISNLKPTSSPDDIAKAFGFNSGEELNNMMSEAKMMELSGFFGKGDKGIQGIQRLLVKNKDGKIDTAATIKALQGSTPTGNAFQVSQWGTNPGALKSTFGTYSGSAGEAFKNIKTQIGDGFISSNEIPAVMKHVTKDNFLDYAPAFANMSSKGRNTAVTQLVNQIPELKDIGSVIKEISGPDAVKGKNDKYASDIQTRYGGAQAQIEEMEAQANKSGNKDLAAALHNQARNLANALAAFDKNMKAKPMSATSTFGKAPARSGQFIIDTGEEVDLTPEEDKGNARKNFRTDEELTSGLSDMVRGTGGAVSDVGKKTGGALSKLSKKWRG